MNSSKSKKILVYVIMGLLSLAAIYSEIVMCIQKNTFSFTVEAIITCAMFVLIVYYAVSSYKIPHGNLLKYLFLAFSIMCFLGLLSSSPNSLLTESERYVFRVLRGAVVILSTYIAGRLDHIKQNMVFMVICAILLLATSLEMLFIYKIVDIILILFYSNFFILWLNLMIAYLFRYYGHKEAGLENN